MRAENACRTPSAGGRFVVGPDRPEPRREEPERIREEGDVLLRGDELFGWKGGVFNEELISSWVTEKRKEIAAVRNRPHPFEMNLYYNL